MVISLCKDTFKIIIRDRMRKRRHFIMTDFRKKKQLSGTLMLTLAKRKIYNHTQENLGLRRRITVTNCQWIWYRGMEWEPWIYPLNQEKDVSGTEGSKWINSNILWSLSYIYFLINKSRGWPHDGKLWNNIQFQDRKKHVSCQGDMLRQNRVTENKPNFQLEIKTNFRP